ncbi:MAG TPA: hypothetical protein VGL40_00580 [Bacillota bacterium]|jgi:hypothetical protein
MKGIRKSLMILVAAVLLVSCTVPVMAAAQSAPAAPAEQQYGEVVVAILEKLGAGGDVDKFQAAGLAPRAAVTLAAIAGVAGQPVDQMIGLSREGRTPQEIAEKVGADWQAVQDKIAEAIGFKRDDSARLQQRLARLEENLAKAEEGYQKILQSQADLVQRIADAEAKLGEIKDERAKYWAEQRITAMKMRQPILQLQAERAQFIINSLQTLIAELQAKLNG